MCIQGAARVAAALRGIPSGVLQTLVVWVPMLPPDTEGAAQTAAQALPGAVHFWDGDRRLASELGRMLGITSAQSLGAPGGHGLAWDVYLAYGRGKALAGPPDFWMHQLAVDHAPRFNADEWRARIQAMIDHGRRG